MKYWLFDVAGLSKLNVVSVTKPDITDIRVPVKCETKFTDMKRNEIKPFRFVSISFRILQVPAGAYFFTIFLEMF
jgi:hypothetical protein